MDFKLKSHKSSTALQDCGAVFGGIKIILPRQAGVVPAMIRGCLEGIRAFIPALKISLCLTTQFKLLLVAEVFRIV